MNAESFISTKNATAAAELSLKEKEKKENEKFAWSTGGNRVFLARVALMVSGWAGKEDCGKTMRTERCLCVCVYYSSKF